MSLLVGGEWAMLAAVPPDEAASSAGRWTGIVIVCIGLAAGALKCWSISRRPATSTKCTLALMFVLLGLAANGLLGTMLKAMADSPGVVLATVLMVLLTLGLLLTGFVLAIIGLSQYSNPLRPFTQGRAQAIWALVLSSIVLLAAIGAFASRGLRAQQMPSASGNTSPGQLLTFDDLNFQFRAPERPWVSVEMAKINKDSKLGFMRRSPVAYFTIVAEQIGTKDFSSQQLAEIGKANLQAAAASARVLSESPLQVHGLDGILVESEAEVTSMHLAYNHWFCATNGFAYQLIGWGRIEDRQRVSDELRQMFSRFDLLDRNRLAVTRHGFSTNFVSARYGYSVQVANSAWGVFPDLKGEFPEAEFGASQVDSCLTVVPVWLGGRELDTEVLAPALLRTMNISYPNEDLINRKLITEGRFGGVQYDFMRSVKGTPVRYRLRMLQGGGNAYLVAAWSQRRAADAERLLTDAIERVTFTDPPVRPLSTNDTFSGRERETQGAVLNGAGLALFNAGEYDKALPLFRDAALAEQEEPLYLQNALQAWRHLDQPNEALRFLEGQPANVLKSAKVRASQAYLQAQASLTEQALTNYAGLFAEGYRGESDFAEYVQLLESQQQFDVALAQVERYLKAEESVAVRLLEAELYRQKRDFPKAIALLRVQHEKAPFNSQVAFALVEACLDAGQFTDALERSRAMVSNKVDSSYAHFLEGRSYVGLKWYREAKASFEAALKLAPSNKEVRSYLDYTSGLLGEGDNSALKEPIEPVLIPAALTNTLVEAAPEDYARSFGAYYVRRLVALAYDRGKQYKTTDYMLVKVLDPSGVSAFSTIQVPFEPGGEELFVNDVRVMDASGKTLSTGKVSDYYVLDEGSSSPASRKKVLNIPVPGLQPGRLLSVTLTRRELGRLNEFPFLQHYFSRHVPVRESVLFLRGDASNVKWQTSPATEVQTIPEGRYWRVTEPMVARWEPLQPPAAQFLPTLWLADGSSQWPVLVSNYLASISDRLELDAALREQVRELVAGLESSEAKLAVLTRYVQTNCTYKAIEFGRRARVPNRPADTAHNKYGDCKDHAVLLQQMLVAAGVPAYLALANVNGIVRQDLGSLDQFNHMVVFVPGQTTASFLDCTDKGSDAAHSIPPGLAGREALVLDPKNPRFLSIPTYPENASTIEARKEVQLVELADARVEETMTLTGVYAASMRGLLLELPTSSQRTVLQRQMGMDDVELADFAVQWLDAADKPLRLRWSYTLKKQFHRSGERVTGVLRAGFGGSYLSAGPVEKRLTPFETTFPLSLRATVVFYAPKGFELEPPAALTPRLDPRFASGKENCHVDSAQLKLEVECTQPAGKFLAADYAAYRETMSQALSLLERSVTLRADKP